MPIETERMIRATESKAKTAESVGTFAGGSRENAGGIVVSESQIGDGAADRSRCNDIIRSDERRAGKGVGEGDTVDARTALLQKGRQDYTREREREKRE